MFMYDPGSPLLRPATGTAATKAPQAKARFAEDRLLDAVLWCEILPGEIVTEADAMARFGLTRAAARSGLTRLGFDGWAMPQPRTGWLVLPVTGALIGQVLDARRIVEPALSEVRLDADARTEFTNIDAILRTLKDGPDEAAASSLRQYADRIESLLLDAINPFTAGHLRKLWYHTARITRFLENPAKGLVFQRRDLADLVQAVLAEDGPGIRTARLTLIDTQQTFFLEQLLQSHAPLTPGSGITGHSEHAATDRRET